MLSVNDLLVRFKYTMQERIDGEGIRWKDSEAIGWLNESYEKLGRIAPQWFSKQANVSLAQGCNQQIPSDGFLFIEAIKNSAAESNGGAIQKMSRELLGRTRPNWMNDTPAFDISHFVPDNLNPYAFMVYPPAEDGAEILIQYAALPSPHSTHLEESGSDDYAISAIHAPASLDWMLYRAFSKDADNAQNAARAAAAYSSFMNNAGTTPTQEKEG